MKLIIIFEHFGSISFFNLRFDITKYKIILQQHESLICLKGKIMTMQ